MVRSNERMELYRLKEDGYDTKTSRKIYKRENETIIPCMIAPVSAEKMYLEYGERTRGALVAYAHHWIPRDITHATIDRVTYKILGFGHGDKSIYLKAVLDHDQIKTRC